MIYLIDYHKFILTLNSQLITFNYSILNFQFNMQSNFRQKLTYRFEQFIGKGGVGIFISLLLMFLVGFLLVYILRLLFPTESNGWLTGAWRTLKEVIDAGNVSLADGESVTSRMITMLSVMIGVILFSMVIAFITTTIDTTIADFRKGRGKILEIRHTLILGWNERVTDILQELIIANESNKHASVVILADGVEKEMMDDYISSKIADFRTTKIITTPGYTAAISEMNRVQAAQAKSVIILAQCSESAPLEDKDRSDNMAIKSIMALRAVQGNKNNLPIICEIFSDEKRELVSYFNDEKIVSLDSWNIMGKLLVQTSLTGGLEMVYNELFGFDGSEIYFYKADWGENRAFYDLVYHFPDGIPIGLYRPEAGKGIGECITIRPPKDTLMQANDEILILAIDDSTLHFKQEQIGQPHELKPSTAKMQKKSKRILMLGWHDISEIFIRESVDYLSEKTVFDVMFELPSEQIREAIAALQAKIPAFSINLIEKSPMSLDSLASVNPLDYDNVLILSQDSGEQSPEKVDSDTLMILLILRKIRKTLGKSKDDTKILTQILNSENQELIQQTDVDDFIISNKMITKILAQLSEQPRLKYVYEELFQADGSEIYVKPLNLYTSDAEVTVDFADLLAAARKRAEICIGVRMGDAAEKPEEHFGIILNPAKDRRFSLKQNDYLIVIAEDEQ